MVELDYNQYFSVSDYPYSNRCEWSGSCECAADGIEGCVTVEKPVATTEQVSA